MQTGKKLKIGILGSRGIPNNYGGFEECAQQIAVRLVKMGHTVCVYNSHNHPYSSKEYQGVELIHKYDPEPRLGSFGQFIYDLNCLVDARKRGFDIILFLGYTSSSIWQKLGLAPKGATVITNMDGLEWQRQKYNSRVKTFLRLAESWAAQKSHLLIADAARIKNYLEQKYAAQTVHIAYGAKVFNKPQPDLLTIYNVEPRQYNLVVARLEPENNLETILKGVVRSRSPRITLVMGNHETAYGETLKKKYQDSRIRFVKSNFNKEEVNNLRHYAHLYFHGHSVGGTNPSLLEAMACSCIIVAHRNPFNLEVLGKNGNYFIDENDVANALEHLERNAVQEERVKNNLTQIKNRYSWKIIAEKYEVVFQQSVIGKNQLKN
jgi:glycosyltransferase involved in cell wall biosynthesis